MEETIHEVILPDDFTPTWKSYLEYCYFVGKHIRDAMNNNADRLRIKSESSYVYDSAFIFKQPTTFLLMLENAKRAKRTCDECMFVVQDTERRKWFCNSCVERLLNECANF